MAQSCEVKQKPWKKNPLEERGDQNIPNCIQIASTSLFVGGLGGN